MIEKKTGKGMKAKLLIAFLTVALVFTMMPLTMGNAYADDDPAVTGDQIAVENEAAETDETSEDAIADEASEDIIVDETEGLSTDPEVEAQGAETAAVTAQEEAASVLIKGNVLAQEKVISAADFSSIMKENVKFDGINKSGRRGAVTVEEGVYFTDLIDYIGLKKEAKIEKIIITTSKHDTGSSAEPETTMSYEWLMTEPNDEYNNGKAMLAFRWNDKGTITTGTRIFVGAFDDMAKATKGDYEGHIANKPNWIDTIDSIEVIGTVPPVYDGDVATVSGNSYIVTSASAGTAALVKAKDAKRVTVPATITVNGKTLNVTQINANAFQGKKIRIVTIGKNVKTIKAYAFKKSKARTLLVKTKNLTKKSIKGSLKGSKVKLVRAKIGSKKTNRKYVKKFRKIFTKKNVGKRVKIRR